MILFDPNDGIKKYEDFYNIIVDVSGKITSLPNMPKRDGSFFKG